jgi:hypothetical protein
LGNEIRAARGRLCTLLHCEGQNWDSIAYITDLEWMGLRRGVKRGVYLCVEEKSFVIECKNGEKISL